MFHEGFLVAVLVRLSKIHGEKVGMWFLEVGFGRVHDPALPLFIDLAEAQDWVVGQLA
ncbi:hypothetical protein ACQKJ1_25495 [Methylorubrum rhodesianum]|uniref:hypothetical protein n=1 Tax=Methylorubrum rhodesianum TaxID=29427 RepID=UPI003CFEB01F